MILGVMLPATMSAQAGFALASSGSSIADAHELRLSCSPTSSSISKSIKPGITLVVLDAPAGALWRLEEVGVELRVVLPLDSQAVDVGQRPPRLGILVSEVDSGHPLRISTLTDTSLEVAGLLTLHCGPSPEISALRACLAAPEAENKGAAVDSTSSMASPGHCSAVHDQNAAIDAFRAGAVDVAEGLYRRTIATWLELGDEARAGAALLGLAETLTRKGRHLEALDSARLSERRSSAAGIEYYALRARAQQCLALRSLGRYREAEECSDPLAEAYVRIGEISEAANALYTVAAMAREDGNQERARKALERALQLPESGITDMVAGRLSQIGAGLAEDSGHLNAALDLYDDAMHRFERVGAPIWIGGAYLGAARLHAALGADFEAAHLVEAAERQFRQAQAPERLASAVLLRAQIEASRGVLQEARALADQAEQAYATGSRPQLRLRAALLGLSVDPGADRARRVQALERQSMELAPAVRFDLAVGLAAFALDSGRAADAHRQLEAIAGDIPDSRRGIRFDLLMAKAEADDGRSESARLRLEAAVDALRAMAADAGSPALRQIVGRRLLELRAQWLATLQRDEMDHADLIERSMRLVVRTQSLALLASAQTAVGLDLADAGASGEELQRRLAQALLTEPGDNNLAIADIQRLLWARYRSEGGARAAGLEWSPQHTIALQGGLGPEDIVLLLGLAEPESVAIVVGRDHLSMHPVAGAAYVRGLAQRLVSLASDRTAAVGEIEAIARSLSESLLPEISVQSPSRLWVVADETLAAVPFGLLFWGGADVPLADIARVSVGPIAPHSARAAASDGELDVRVFTAGTGYDAGRALPHLASAPMEAGWIGEALPEADRRDAVLDLPGLRQALSVAGSWVHVAGHGRSRGGLQGHSGLWVEANDASDRPSFISWIDLVGERLEAQLLVLNACDLAATGAGVVSRASSFGVALHAAGVEDVVAALWPVSDSAAALWVPAFYQELARQRSSGRYDPAAAVTAAQRRLRASRMFRHPFYWASMVHVAGPRVGELMDVP